MRKQASYCGVDTSSAGFEKSPTFATEIIHLKVGAQKKTKNNYIRGILTGEEAGGMLDEIASDSRPGSPQDERS